MDRLRTSLTVRTVVWTKITIRSYAWSFGHSDPDPSNVSGESIGELAGHIGMKSFSKQEEFHTNIKVISVESITFSYLFNQKIFSKWLVCSIWVQKVPNWTFGFWKKKFGLYHSWPCVLSYGISYIHLKSCWLTQESLEHNPFSTFCLICQTYSMHHFK